MQLRSRTGVSKEVWIVATLLAVGLLIRLALYFPPAMFQIDSDAVIAGLCGLRVMDGHHPIFLPGGIRIGSASCYAAAGYFYLLGFGRAGLALTGLTWGALYLLFSWLFFQATLGTRLALIAFLFAIVPSEQFMTVTYAPWGYGEIMALCVATLWLASEWRQDGAIWVRVCFGLAVGLGIWFSLQTLMVTIPAIVWIALKRRSASVRESLIAVPSVLVGAAPFLVVNITTGFPSLTQNSYSQTVSHLSQAVANFAWLVTNLLPKLLFRYPASPDWLVLLAAFALVAIGFAIALKGGIPELIRSDRLNEVGQLLAFVLLASVLIFSFSAAGLIRGWTVRYITPLYVVVPVFYSIGAAGLWRWNRTLATFTVAALLIPNLVSYGLPGSTLRNELTTQLRDDRSLRERLARQHIHVVYGDYLWVYHLNFDSHEQIAGVPFQEAYDYYHYGDRLGTSRVRWALLGDLDQILAWSRAVGARGSLSRSGDLWVFIAKLPAANSAHLFVALRRH